MDWKTDRFHDQYVQPLCGDTFPENDNSMNAAPILFTLQLQTYARHAFLCFMLVHCEKVKQKQERDRERIIPTHKDNTTALAQH